MFLGDFFQIELRLQLHLRRETLSPEAQPFFGPWHGKVDDRLEAASKSVVQIFAAVGGENSDAVEGFDALEQEGDLLVGVPVVGILGLAAFAKERIRFIKKENPAFVLRLVKDFSQVLLGLA